MKIVYLGKERYRTRPSVTEFLKLAGSLGHTAVLLDRSAFLATSLDNVHIVLAKSHYKNPDIWNHLDRFSVRVINSRSATDLCVTRRTVFDVLGRAGIPLLPYVQDELTASSVPLPWIAKPDRGGDHRLRIHRQRPPQLDLDRFFYQQLIPSAEVYKLYTVGRQHFLVLLRYGDGCAISCSGNFTPCSSAKNTPAVKSVLTPSSGACWW